VSPSELLALAQQRLAAADLPAADNFALMVLEKYPAYAPAWLLRAEVAVRAGQTGQLPALLTEAERLGGAEDGTFHLRCGGLWRAVAQLPAATVAFRRAVEAEPTLATAWQALGVAQQELGRPAEAAAAYQRALALDDTLAHSHNNYAILFQQAGQVDRALGHYRRAIALLPDYGVAWKNYANLLQASGKLPDALTAYERATQCLPGDTEAQAGALHLRMLLLDWQGLAERSEALDRLLTAEHWTRYSPFIQLGLADDPARQRQVAERWAAAYAPTLPALARREADRARLRVAYLGGDFFAHATSWLTRGLFKRHDRERFEVIAYDYGKVDESVVRSDIMAGVEHFEAVGALDDATLARYIRAADIDILVDIKGWTRNSRTHLLAERLAPLQVHYLGFPGTLGASWCDYLIADATVVPPGQEQYYREAIVRLPDCYQINDNERLVAPLPDRVEAALPEAGMVYCCFNQHYKLTPALFQIWLEILQAVPGSVLWLLAGSPVGMARLQDLAAQAGVSPGRLIFAPALPQAAHLARLGLADLALDTLPCNSHTTASDALWMGVPMLTCLGRGYAARVAASCLRAARLPELVVDSLSAYKDLAIRLGHDRAHLAALKQRLLAERLHSALFDTDTKVTQLEAAYLAMWQHHLRGEQPAGFDLPTLAD